MVLDLVVEPAVEEVVQVAQRGARRARGEVGRRDDLAKVEGGRAWRAVLLEAVEVVSRMIRGDDDEAVEVRAELRQGQSDQGD